MNSASLAIVAESLINVGGAIAERLRQESAGARSPFTAVTEHFDLEVLRLRREGQDALADALGAFRNHAGEDA